MLVKPENALSLSQWRVTDTGCALLLTPSEELGRKGPLRVVAEGGVWAPPRFLFRTRVLEGTCRGSGSL